MPAGASQPQAQRPPHQNDFGLIQLRLHSGHRVGIAGVLGEKQHGVGTMAVGTSASPRPQPMSPMGVPYLEFTEVPVQGCVVDCRRGSRRPVYFADLPGEFIQHLRGEEAASYCLAAPQKGSSPLKRRFFSSSSFPFEPAKGTDRNQLPWQKNNRAVPMPGRGGCPQLPPKPCALPGQADTSSPVFGNAGSTAASGFPHINPTPDREDGVFARPTPGLAEQSWD